MLIVVDQNFRFCQDHPRDYDKVVLIEVVSLLNQIFYKGVFRLNNSGLNRQDRPKKWSWCNRVHCRCKRWKMSNGQYNFFHTAVKPMLKTTCLIRPVLSGRSGGLITQGWLYSFYCVLLLFYWKSIMPVLPKHYKIQSLHGA